MSARRTEELMGAELDWWVAKAQGIAAQISEVVCVTLSGRIFWPSKDWAQGGPILVAAGITVVKMQDMDEDGGELPARFYAFVVGDKGTGTRYFDQYIDDADGSGDTYLEAAMRAYVASVYGEEVSAEEISAKIPFQQ